MTDILLNDSQRDNSVPEFSLEYLVIFINKLGFYQSMRDFCEWFDLSIDDENGKHISASGDDFSIRATTITTGQEGKAALLRVYSKSEYDLTLAREIIEEKENGVAFSRMIILRDSVAEERTKEAYVLLNELENVLRKMVAVRAATLSGDSWWQDRVLVCLDKNKNGSYKYEQYRSKEVSDNKITPEQQQDYHDLFYLDLSVIKKVIENESNWKDGFEFDIRTVRNIERLDLLNRLRRKIAHNRFLSSQNIEELRRIHAQIMTVYRRAFE